MKTKTAKLKSSAIGYEGNVKISILKNKKVIRSKTIHNTGTYNLFYGMAASIAGRHVEANRSRPKYIRLYSSGKKVGDTVDYDWFNFKFYDECLIEGQARSHYLIYNASPSVAYQDHKVTQGSRFTDEATTTFKFVIPYIKIFGDDVNVFTLYSDTLNLKEPCAYFALTKLDENTKKDVWGSLSDLTADLKEYNVSIEWTISIKNKEE